MSKRKMKEEKVNYKMITLARESRGITQAELADKLQISIGKMSKVETADQTLNEEAMEKLCEALKYPKSFFYQQGEALPMSLNFRKRAVVAQKLLVPLEAKINIHRLHVETLVKAMKMEAPKIPILDIEKYDTPQEVARQLRRIWKVPKGTIENMTELLESNGIIIIQSDFNTERVDSKTILTEGKYPIIVINKLMQTDRLRFSLAFELAHLVMHVFTSPSFKRDLDHEANEFAAEFLLPEKEVIKDLQGDISIALLADLKRKWKVSMQALLYRADDLGLLTYNQKRYLLGQFNTLQIRRREPPELDILKEKNLLLKNLIIKYRQAQRMNIRGIAGFFHLEQSEFEAMYTQE